MNNGIVEQITVDPFELLPAKVRWRILLPSVLVMTAFVIILTVGEIAALVLPAQADMFAPYSDLFPGESEAQMALYPCTLFEQTPGSASGGRKIMCVITPEQGIFRRVSVFTSDGKITGINFHMRHVRLVDLIWQWGKPDQLYKVGGEFTVVWKGQFHITAAIERRYSVQAPVRLIAISNPPTEANRPGDSYLCSGKNGDKTMIWGCNFSSTLTRH